MLVISVRMLLAFNSFRGVFVGSHKFGIAQTDTNHKGHVGGQKIAPVMLISVMQNPRKRLTQCFENWGRHLPDFIFETK